MKTIRFSDDELQFLKEHYEMELDEMEKYISDVKGMLKKLGAAIAERGDDAPKKRRGRPPMKAQLPKEDGVPEANKRGRGRPAGAKNKKKTASGKKVKKIPSMPGYKGKTEVVIMVPEKTDEKPARVEKQAPPVAEVRKPETVKKAPSKPKAKSQKPKASSQKPKASSQKPKASSQKPKASSQKPKANSQKPKASSQKPKAVAPTASGDEKPTPKKPSLKKTAPKKVVAKKPATIKPVPEKPVTKAPVPAEIPVPDKPVISAPTGESTSPVTD